MFQEKKKEVFIDCFQKLVVTVIVLSLLIFMKHFSYFFNSKINKVRYLPTFKLPSTKPSKNKVEETLNLELSGFSYLTTLMKTESPANIDSFPMKYIFAHLL